RAALLHVDADRLVVVDQGVDDVLEHGAGGRHLDRRGGVGHAEPSSAGSAAPSPVAAGAPSPPRNCCHAPEISSSLRTASVGWAPLRSQSTALSLSMRTTDGSRRGS